MMEHTITRTIPEGEYCTSENQSEPCPFLIGDEVDVCFVCEEALDNYYYPDGKEDGEDAPLIVKHAKCPARKSLKFVISEKDIADILRSQNFKPTPEVVEAILKDLEKDNFAGMLVCEVMYNAGIPTLENLEPE